MGTDVGFRTPHKGPESWGLGDDADNPIYIFTESRVGYRMPKGEGQERRSAFATYNSRGCCTIWCTGAFEGVTERGSAQEGFLVRWITDAEPMSILTPMTI